jgi:hypothetical protein
MLRLLHLVLLISGGLALAQVHDVHYQGDFAPRNITPTSDHGFLVAYDTDHRIDLFGPDGALLYRAAVQVPNPAWADIENAAVDTDGTLAAAIRVFSKTGQARGGAIALFDRNGAQIRCFDTGDFLPTQVAFGPDHAIWTLGWLEENAPSLTEDYAILRKYAQDGTAQGAFLPRASFPVDPVRELPTAPIVGLWQLRVEADRVEAILDRARLWVETDLNGHETGRWEIAPNGRTRAITQTGSAWRIHGNRLEVFDRSTGSWHAVPFALPDGWLLGADGNDLVFEMRDRVTLRWVPAPEGLLSAGSSTSQTRQ